jgi:DNA-binding IclR family transcriptional regulator
MTAMIQSGPRVDALFSGLILLEALADLEVATLSQLADKASLTSNRTFRMIGTLVESGYVIREGNKTYRLGPKILLLGHRCSKTDPLMRVAMPEIERVARETGEAVFLGVRIGLRQVTIASQAPLLGWVPAPRTQPQLPLHTGSMGLCLLSFAPEPVVKAVLGGPREQFTKTTLVDPNDLMHAIDGVREQGYRISTDEFTRGWTSIAAPLLDRDGLAAAAVAIGVNNRRLSKAKTKDYIAAVKRTAAAISARML